MPPCQLTFRLDVLDGAMIVLATFTMNFLHPGFLLGNGSTWNHPQVQPSRSLETVTESPEKGVVKSDV